MWPSSGGARATVLRRRRGMGACRTTALHHGGSGGTIAQRYIGPRAESSGDLEAAVTSDACRRLQPRSVSRVLCTPEAPMMHASYRPLAWQPCGDLAIGCARMPGDLGHGRPRLRRREIRALDD